MLAAPVVLSNNISAGDPLTRLVPVGGDATHSYRTLLNRTYVDDNPRMRWCPAPNCEYAIHCAVAARSLDIIVPTVQCACGHVFCFGCTLDGDHRPCCCPIVKRWLQKCKDDSETSNWISANTKECTKCHSTIEKNGGCNVEYFRARAKDRGGARSRKLTRVTVAPWNST